LLFLPAYSPDLNPIERVWELTRRLSVHNRYFPELSDVVKSVEFQFDQWSTKNDDLRRLCVI
jgi:transposase